MSFLKTFQNMMLASGSYRGDMQRALFLSFWSSVVTGWTLSCFFLLMQQLLVDNEEDSTSTKSNNGLCVGLGMLVLTILEGLLRWGQLESEYTTQMDAAEETRIHLGEKLREMPLEQLEKRQTGDLNVVLSGDVNDVVMIMGSLYAVVIQTIVAPLTAIVVTFLCVDSRVALCQACFFPIAIPLYQHIRNVASEENRVSKQAHANVTNHLIEYAQGLEVLRATRQVGTQSIRLQAAFADLRQKQTAANNYGVLPNILMSTIVQVGMLVVTLQCVNYCWNGTLPVHVLLAVMTISVRFAEPLSIFASLATMFDFMESGLERIKAMHEIEPLPVLKVDNKNKNNQLAAAAGLDVTFDNVSFSYAAGDNNDDGNNVTGKKVLSDVSFHVPAKSLTALVGESGGGKTTITKLMSRYADPQVGSIRIGDGIDIRSLKQSELMQHISVVFQDVYLFDDTIRNNIRMAKPDATNEQVEAAAKAAYCHEFISSSRLPDGYDTQVGEIGGALSGGERQRISIARAILKDAPIVILDEPTSALDTESEVAVQRAIDSLVKNKTVLVIAHRLSTVVAANQILILQEGRIVERGTHKDLLALDEGRYAAMWAAQQQERRWKV